MNLGVQTNDLQQKLSTLRRAPPPRPPVCIPGEGKAQEGELFNVKLRSRSASGNISVDNVKNGNNSDNDVKEQAVSIKERSKIFQNGSPGKPLVPVKPLVQKKLAFGVKQPDGNKPTKPVNSNTNENATGLSRSRPPSVINKPDPQIVSKDSRIPELTPLPPESQAPEKPPKFGLLKPSLKKYLGTSYPPRPVPQVLENTHATSSGNVPLQPPVHNAPPIPKKPVRTEPGKSQRDEEKKTVDDVNTSTNGSCPDDIYDDTAGSASNDASDDFYDDTSCNTTSTAPVDFYDDTDCTNDLSSAEPDHTFGDDIYEPIIAQDIRKESETSPPALPAKDQGKEDKKKKDKERKRKEKEEKEKEEKEKKKRDKDRGKKLAEMRQRFSVKGNEKALGTCRAAEDILGNKMDITASIGEEFDIIKKGKPNPKNKWLVRNKQGLYGFIDINKIEQATGAETEELYEIVPASKMRTSQSCQNIPEPPATSPPPPPSQNVHKPPGVAEQEIYDDVGGQDDEVLYECLPEN